MTNYSTDIPAFKQKKKLEALIVSMQNLMDESFSVRSNELQIRNYKPQPYLTKKMLLNYFFDLRQKQRNQFKGSFGEGIVNYG
jgi:predicted branched-subunit amino acid permease